MVDYQRRGFLMKGADVLLYSVGMSVSPFLFADSPLLMTIQGRLSDSTGAPISGNKDISIKLVDASGAPQPVGNGWTESHLATSVTDGFFFINLGSKTPLSRTMFENAPTDAFGKALFVEITVGSEVMTPNMRLTSSAFSILNEGEKGAPGTQGEKGQVGTQGTKGEVGSKGEIGLKGIAGEKGDLGPSGGQKGATGAQGNLGQKGVSGPTGAQGAQGAQGHQGHQGIVGQKGMPGATGAQGTTGNEGTTGATGAKGDKGDLGQKGVSGATGAQGPTGAEGAAGQKGEKGMKGATG